MHRSCRMLIVCKATCVYGNTVYSAQFYCELSTAFKIKPIKDDDGGGGGDK